jgi:hypothetical protein
MEGVPRQYLTSSGTDAAHAVVVARKGLERLATLIPPPRRHGHRYHRALAPPFRREQNGTALAGPERTDPRRGSAMPHGVRR